MPAEATEVSRGTDFLWGLHMHVRLTQSNIGAKGEQQKQNTTNGEGKYICVSVLREDRIKRLHCGDRPSLMMMTK